MDIGECFPSKYVGHADLRGQDATVHMATVVMEDIDQNDGTERNGRSRKPILYFQGMTKGLVLNKTNAARIAALYGPETANWTGQSIVLYTAETEYGGKACKCIRVREPQAAAVAAAPPVAVAPPVAPAPAPQVGAPVPAQTSTVPTGPKF